LTFIISVLLVEAKRFSSNFFDFAFNIVIIYFCFAHSSVGSSIWIFPLFYIIFKSNRPYNYHT
jgi:hypothetical protein